MHYHIKSEIKSVYVDIGDLFIFIFRIIYIRLIGNRRGKSNFYIFYYILKLNKTYRSSENVFAFQL